MIAKYNRQILLIVLGALFFFPFLGYVHLFDWDEINFAESSREMMISGNFFQNQINFEPFWEKPPLFFWLQSISMSIFGLNEFGARFPNALFGIITLLFIFNIGKRLYNDRFGIMWALLYLGSLLPHLYFRSGIIDPIFNLFIFGSLYYIVRTIQESHPKKAANFAVISGILIGLAIITKGPVGLLILLLTVIIFWILNRFRSITTLKNLFLFTLFALLTSFLWFGYETFKNGPWFLGEFFAYQIELFTGAEGGAAAGHQQPFYYHFIVILVGCFPISILALGNLFGSRYLDDRLHFRKWMNILFWVVMILFSIVSTKIVHYSSMAYLPLSFMAAYYLFQVDRGKENMSKWLSMAVGFLGIAFALAIAFIPILILNKESWLLPYLKDDFAVDALSMDVSWTGFESGIGIPFLFFVIAGVYQLFKKKVFRFVVINAIGLSLMLLLTSIFILPKIERYSQGPAIDFYQSLKGKDAYIWPLQHKSYGHYFYAQTQPLQTGDGLSFQKNLILKELDKEKYGELKGKERLTYHVKIQNWLLKGKIDKPVYFVIKSNHFDPNKYPTLTVVMRKG
ncbi:MAG: glycosyltransferase family 39 protein, partial [Flavobacteriales bacterium]|nr:glycosyltransferase family 39 protein [Flavobacteriales bacterium]